ncbi:hypothetical protein TNCT_732301 [Trichonephila clavata]|uniref:Uncharacterized protein n=1 Tax=Trichonephila clavata TaxID=2740835 RepID=A0A8X6LDH7_TRICU|nr:hypothetical protein TNCT_732301 [Trichonephila clavata]
MESQSFTELSPFTKGINNSKTSEQISALSSETTMVKSIKYNCYDDNGKKIIIDIDDFEEEEKEMKDLFDSDWTSSSNNPNFKMGSYKDAFHLKPTSTDALLVNSTDKNYIIGNTDLATEGEISNDTFNSNSVSSFSNPNFEMGSNTTILFFSNQFQLMHHRSTT